MKKSLIVIVALICAGVAAWLVVKSRRAPNEAPTAALRLDSIDLTNRIVALSDGGSRDPDGTVQSWRIAWGDGKEENVSAIPQKAPHTYASDGEYRISLWCVDNLGATSSPPASTNVIFDFEKRRKALEAQAAQAKLEADRLKDEQARKDAERLAQEQAMAAEEARKAKEQQELEAKRKAAEMARQKAIQAEAAGPAPTPLASELPDKSSSTEVIYTPPGYTIGEFQILKEKVEGKTANGNVSVILAIRCVNFPLTPIVTSNWRIDGQEFQIPGGRIRVSLPAGAHDITARLKNKTGLVPGELKADLAVQPNGDCILKPGK